jgi:hypothetical protein
MLAFFAFAFISGLSWIIYQLINRPDDNTSTSTLTQDTFVIPHPPAATCVSMVEAFLQCSSASELSRLTRLKRMDPENAYSVFVQFRKNQGPIDRVEWMGVEETNGLSLERVEVIYKTGQYRIASLVDTKDGEWKIDFESFIAHNSKAWDQIAAQGSCNAVVRATVTTDSYYNGYFQSEKEWICLALRFPDRSEIVYGYVPPKSPAFWDIVEILRSSNPADMILEISRDAGMNRMQFEIRSVIAQGWVESDVAFSARKIKKTPDNQQAQ